jgi:hypothetical protein
MARSLLTGWSIALVGVATLMSCSSDDGRPSSSGGGGGGDTGGGGTSSSSAAGGAGGQGGAAISSSGVGGTGGAGGAGGGVQNLDQDGDGWTPADGDCCDIVNGDCDKPQAVNPGAFEYLANMIDDDCDPTTLDSALPDPCSTTPLDLPTTSQKLVQAMDLCNSTTEDAPLPERRWGVISSALALADGTTDILPNDVQVGVLSNFGPNVMPKRGATMAALSSGTARDEDDIGHVYPQNGAQAQVGSYNAGTAVNVPGAYLAVHGGSLPSSCGPACDEPECPKAFDSVDLKVKIRVPTNASSFSYNFKFYTAEFPERVCQKYNDFFLALLKTSYQTCPGLDPNAPCMPLDLNVASEAMGRPVSVNNAFLPVCFPPPGAPVGSCPGGTLELDGTGYGGWDGSVLDGGGTDWLTNDAPVVPGETIDIEFILFDAGDHNVDSLVLLDKFRWNPPPPQIVPH